MSDSLLNPMTIEERALRIAMETAVRAFPNVSCLSVESRADMLHSDYLNRLWDFMQNEFGNGVSGEVAVGVETASEYNRNLLGKGISDAVLVSASRVLSDTMWSMRGSLIYALFEHEPLARVLALKNGIDLMAGLGERMRTYTSILLLRGYVPEDMASSNLFRDFVEVPDEVVLRELREAALHAKRRKLHFEIDSTTADQEAVRATLGIMSPEYRAALDRYNQSLDPRELVLK